MTTGFPPRASFSHPRDCTHPSIPERLSPELKRPWLSGRMPCARAKALGKIPLFSTRLQVLLCIYGKQQSGGPVVELTRSQEKPTAFLSQTLPAPTDNAVPMFRPCRTNPVRTDPGISALHRAAPAQPHRRKHRRFAQCIIKRRG